MSKKRGVKTEGWESSVGYAGGVSGPLLRDDDWVTRYMPSIEERLANLTRSPIGEVTKIAHHMIFASGKRLRPAFTLAGYLLTAGGLSPQAVELASCSEILHCAALFHDDVIDSSVTRKGRSSANAVWGNSMAVTVGDYLMGVTFHVIGNLKRQDIFDEYIQLSLKLAEGVILELVKTSDFKISEPDYLDVISRKTAHFYRTAIRCGAMLAGAPKEIIDNAGKFGFDFGMAFQITDDILDLFSEEEATGKPRGLDISEGTYTLPIIYALRKDDGSLVRILNKNDEYSDGDIDFIAERVEANGGLAYSIERAKDYHRRAMEALRELPSGETRDFLERIADSILTRRF